MYVFWADITFWDDMAAEEKTEHCALIAPSFPEASQQIENYYGINLNTVSLQVIGDSRLIFLDAEWKERFITRNENF